MGAGHFGPAAGVVDTDWQTRRSLKQPTVSVAAEDVSTVAPFLIPLEPLVSALSICSVQPFCLWEVHSLHVEILSACVGPVAGGLWGDGSHPVTEQEQ